LDPQFGQRALRSDDCFDESNPFDAMLFDDFDAGGSTAGYAFFLKIETRLASDDVVWKCE